MAANDQFSWTTGSNKIIFHRREIARGAFGQVHELYNGITGELFARKILDQNSLQPGDVDNERRAITKLCQENSHPNIVAVFQQGQLSLSHYFIDMELCTMNLEDFIHRDVNFAISRCGPHFIRDWEPPFKAIQIWNIISQITRGVEFLHYHNEVHRDLKPRNILYSPRDFIWKLADFGLTSEGKTTQANHTEGARGTPSYLAPGVIEKRTFTKKADVWAIGCILYELCFGRKAFHDDWAVRAYAFEKEPLDMSLDERTFNSIDKKRIIGMLSALLNCQAWRRLPVSDILLGISEFHQLKDQVETHITSTTQPHAVPAPNTLPVIAEAVGLEAPRAKGPGGPINSEELSESSSEEGSVSEDSRFKISTDARREFNISLDRWRVLQDETRRCFDQFGCAEWLKPGKAWGSVPKAKQHRLYQALKRVFPDLNSAICYHLFKKRCQSYKEVAARRRSKSRLEKVNV